MSTRPDHRQHASREANEDAVNATVHRTAFRRILRPGAHVTRLEAELQAAVSATLCEVFAS